jgi:hypothetical protein
MRIPSGREWVAAAAVLALACQAPTAQPAAQEAGSAPAPTSTASTGAGFVNRVWSVRESTSVAAGTLYVFLSDGTLVVTASTGKPSLGRWSAHGDGLTMVEEGIPYEVDVLELSADEFTIRSHNPGEAVVITLVPAPSPQWEG